FLSAVRQCLIEAYARPVRPIEELINALGLKSIDNQSPLFDIAVILTGFHKTMPEMRNDLTLIFTQGNDGVSGVFEYNSSVLKKESVKRFSSHFEIILRQILECYGARIADLQILTNQEREKILLEWNPAKKLQSSREFAHNLVAEKAAQRPDAV